MEIIVLRAKVNARCEQSPCPGLCVCAWMLVISEDGALLNNNFVGQSV